MRYLVLMLALLCSGCPAMAQTVTYKGRQYSGRVCSNPRCSMCATIEAKQAQVRQQQRQQQISVLPVVEKTNEIVPVQTALSSRKMVQVSRQVTRYRSVKQCINGVCSYIQVPYSETVVEWVPAPERPKQKPATSEEGNFTPQNLVSKMVELLELDRSSVFFDLGAGDGRIVVAAAKTGADAYGIEIDKQLARQAHQNAQKHGATVYHGDATASDLSSATHVAMYLFPDVMFDLVQSLQPGTRIVSYSHRIPGLDNEAHHFGEDVIYVATVPSRVPLAGL